MVRYNRYIQNISFAREKYKNFRFNLFCEKCENFAKIRNFLKPMQNLSKRLIFDKTHVQRGLYQQAQLSTDTKYKNRLKNDQETYFAKFLHFAFFLRNVSFPGNNILPLNQKIHQLESDLCSLQYQSNCISCTEQVVSGLNID